MGDVSEEKIVPNPNSPDDDVVPYSLPPNRVIPPTGLIPSVALSEDTTVYKPVGIEYLNTLPLFELPPTVVEP